MKLATDRRVLFLDLEGTGPDPYNDRIVEMCFVEDGKTLLSTRVNPGRRMSEEVIAVHGILNEEVEGLPPFDAWAARVQAIIDGAVLVHYNGVRYDSILLDRELRLAKQPGLARDEVGRICQDEIDLFGIWSRVEPRNLTTAGKRFAGVDLGENAHAAGADTLVLPDILEGLLREFSLPPTVEELAKLSRPEGAIDRDGKFVRREDGVVVFNFSKSRGQPVLRDPGLLEWMLNKDFSPETLAFAREFLDECYSGGPSDDLGDSQLW